jgi:hypothetical protein
MTFSCEWYISNAFLLCPDIRSGIVYPDVVEPLIAIRTSEAVKSLESLVPVNCTCLQDELIIPGYNSVISTSLWYLSSLNWRAIWVVWHKDFPPAVSLL